MLELYIAALNSDSTAQIVAVALSNEGGSSRGRAGARAGAASPLAPQRCSYFSRARDQGKIMIRVRVRVKQGVLALTPSKTRSSQHCCRSTKVITALG